MNFKDVIKNFVNSINEKDTILDNNRTLINKEISNEKKPFYDQYELYASNPKLVGIFSKFVKENSTVSLDVIYQDFNSIENWNLNMGINDAVYESLIILKNELTACNLEKYKDDYYLSKFITYETGRQTLHKIEKKINLSTEVSKDENPFELFFDSYLYYHISGADVTLALSYYLYTLSHKIEYSSYSEFWNIANEEYNDFTSKKDNLIREYLKSKRIPYFYKNFEQYEKQDISKKYISNFIKVYYKESTALLIPDIEDALDTGVAFVDADMDDDRKIVDSYGLPDRLHKWGISEEEFILLCKNIHKLSTLISSKDSFFSKIDSFKRGKLLIEFLKYELSIFNYQRNKKEFIIVKDEIFTISSLFNNYFDNLLVKDEMKELVKIDYISYALFENNFYTEYDDLDDLYSTIKVYYKNYEKEKFNQKIEEDLDEKRIFTNKNNIEEFIDSISGVEFESLLEELFNSLAYDILKTKASGDQGADLILKKNNITYAVQAKRYSNSVGNSAVQEAIAGKHYYDTDIAMVITSNYFTPHAISLAEKSNVILWDRDKLLSAIEISGM